MFIKQACSLSTCDLYLCLCIQIFRRWIRDCVSRLIPIKSSRGRSLCQIEVGMRTPTTPQAPWTKSSFSRHLIAASWWHHLNFSREKPAHEKWLTSVIHIPKCAVLHPATAPVLSFSHILEAGGEYPLSSMHWMLFSLDVLLPQNWGPYLKDEDTAACFN